MIRTTVAFETRLCIQQMPSAFSTIPNIKETWRPIKKIRAMNPEESALRDARRPTTPVHVESWRPSLMREHRMAIDQFHIT